MQEDELVLSDVHLGNEHVNLDETIDYVHATGNMQLTVATSSFPFRWPSTADRPNSPGSQDPSKDGSSPCQPDEDGDLRVRRKCRPSLSLELEHSMASPLPLVGLQVWTGALVLCDYLLHHGSEIKDKTVLEVGAGTGICSIVAAFFASRVFCTDYDHQVLKLCLRNVEQNAHLVQRCSELFRPHAHIRRPHAVEVRELNLARENPFSFTTTESYKSVKESDEWLWTENDLKNKNQIEIIMAADVIYDDRLTDDLFRLLENLIGEPPKKTILLSLERRLNFTLEKLDVSCPAHDHFLRRLSEWASRDKSVHKEKIPTDFPQHFDYKRTEYLEIWKISNC